MTMAELTYEQMCLSCKHFDVPPRCKLNDEETEPTFGCDKHEAEKETE